MAYLVKQKFNVADLARIPEKKNRVLIYGSDLYLCQLYASYLRLCRLETRHCASQDLVANVLSGFMPSLLLVDLDSLSYSGDSWLKNLNFNRDFPSLLIVTISGNSDSKSVAKLMSAGVSSHINRKFSRPQDVAEVVKVLLQ
ncbi:MAG: hypothetical protein P4L74_05295 [Candidatus Doudnabacteria bacterium]|nr:hypothetical protein [Candidatus Doudnabacteria bacterium]